MRSEVERLNQVDRDDVTDPELVEIVEKAERSMSPPVAWYLTMGNNPEVAAAFARYWETLHRGGTVAHEKKLGLDQVEHPLRRQRQLSWASADCVGDGVRD